jgi:hypothetical protein
MTSDSHTNSNAHSVQEKVSTLVAPVVVVLTGCGRALTGELAQEIASDALAPNTSSGDRANWEVIAAEVVQGRDMADEFERATLSPVTGL